MHWLAHCICSVFTNLNHLRGSIHSATNALCSTATGRLCWQPKTYMSPFYRLPTFSIRTINESTSSERFVLFRTICPDTTQTNQTIPPQCASSYFHTLLLPQFTHHRRIKRRDCCFSFLLHLSPHKCKHETHLNVTQFNWIKRTTRQDNILFWQTHTIYGIMACASSSFVFVLELQTCCGPAIPFVWCDAMLLDYVYYPRSLCSWKHSGGHT